MRAEIAEYKDVEIKDFSVRTVLSSKTIGNRTYNLVHRTKGWECAGSCVRMACEAYGVLFEFENATHGQWFLDIDEAQDTFSKWTERAEEDRRGWARVFPHGR